MVVGGGGGVETRLLISSTSSLPKPIFTDSRVNSYTRNPQVQIPVILSSKYP